MLDAVAPTGISRKVTPRDGAGRAVRAVAGLRATASAAGCFAALVLALVLALAFELVLAIATVR